MSTDVAPRLAKNSAFYAIKSVVALAALLLITPYILNTIGKDQYGIWALAGVLTAYTQLSDFGISEGVIKYAAEFHADRDYPNLNRLVNTSFVFLLILAISVGIILFFLLPVITGELLKIPVLFQAEALFIFRMSVLIFLFNVLLGIFSSLVISSQKIGYTCSINVTTVFVGFSATIFFLHNGWGLRSLIATNAVVAFVTGLLNITVAFRLFPELQINLSKWVDRQMFRQIFNYSWKVQTTSISQIMIFQVDRIFLSRYLGLEAVAYYEIGSNMAFYVKTFLVALFTPIVPAASELQAKNEHAMICGLYRRSFKFMVMLSVPFCLLVIALADPFIKFWMGDGFALSALTLQLLIPAYLVSVLTVPGIFILNGTDRPDVAMRTALFAGTLNLLLCFVLLKTVGYFGLIAGITVSIVASAGYFAYMLHRVLPELEWGIYRKTLFMPVLFSAPLVLLLYYLDRVWSLANFTSLLMASTVYLTVIVMLLLKTSYLDDFERKIFGGIFLLRQR